jgi:hypothetical protein
MIVGFALGVCDLFLLGMLLYKQEYSLLQLMLLTQICFAVALIPFFVRAETLFDKAGGWLFQILIVILAGAVVGGIGVQLEEYWENTSVLNSQVRPLVAESAELILVLCAQFMVSALVVSAFLRRLK